MNHSKKLKREKVKKLNLTSLTLKKGEAAFLWFNDYAGVAIRTPSKTLIIDPVNVDPAIFKKVDALLITHEHLDHFDKSLAMEVYRRNKCIVIADSTSVKRLRDVFPAGKLHEMRLDKEVKLDNITVRAESFRHPATTPAGRVGSRRGGPPPARWFRR